MTSSFPLSIYIKPLETCNPRPPSSPRFIVSHPLPEARLVLLLIKHPPSLCLWAAQEHLNWIPKSSALKNTNAADLHMHNGCNAPVGGALASPQKEFAELQITSFSLTSVLFFLVLFITTTWMSSCSHQTPAPSGQTLGLAGCTQADSSCLGPSCTGFWCKSFQSLDRVVWNPAKEEEEEWTTTRWGINRMSQSCCGVSVKTKNKNRLWSS